MLSRFELGMRRQPDEPLLRSICRAAECRGARFFSVHFPRYSPRSDISPEHAIAIDIDMVFGFPHKKINYGSPKMGVDSSYVKALSQSKKDIADGYLPLGG